VRIVLPPEGGVKGRVAFSDGTAPALFTVSAGMGNNQSFAGGDGAFTIDALPPQKYELTVRGPSFQTRVVEVEIPAGRTADAGTVTVQKGRAIAGIVVADGQPVAGAKVTAGRMMFGNGTQSNAPMGPMGAGAKTDTTDENGQFRLTGFPDGDITIVAEHDTLGRSKGVRLPTVMPGQTELTLTIEKFGSLSGVLRNGGKPAEGVFVSVQSTTTPGAVFGVASGPDGSYRYDRLAPDTYKVSATMGFPMRGMRFYSKQVDVPPGKEVKIDLVVEEGNLTLDVTLVPKVGPMGGAQAFISSAPITAKMYSELGLKMAAAGLGSSAWVIVRAGAPASFTNLAAGTYSVCAMVLPREVKGMAGFGYIERHSDSLPAFCRSVVVQAAPTTQTASLDVELPPFIPDDTGTGSGSGAPPPGPGSGSGT
jgi:hypothetical protein